MLITKLQGKCQIKWNEFEGWRKEGKEWRQGAGAVRAREYLRSHTGEPLGTASLARLLGCSPRLLQLSYRSVFGRTVQEDIAEARLALARKLLADKRIPICDIPGRIGFESPGHFMQFFKARTGMTMLQWRKQPKSS